MISPSPPPQAEAFSPLTPLFPIGRVFPSSQPTTPINIASPEYSPLSPSYRIDYDNRPYLPSSPTLPQSEKKVYSANLNARYSPISPAIPQSLTPPRMFTLTPPTRPAPQRKLARSPPANIARACKKLHFMEGLKYEETNSNRHFYTPINTITTMSEAIFRNATEIPIIKGDQKFYPSLSKEALKEIKSGKVGRQLNQREIIICATQSTKSVGDTILNQNTTGLNNAKVEIRGDRLLYYLYRNSYTSVGWFRVSLVQVHPSEVTPKVSAKNMLIIKEKNTTRCPLKEVVPGEARKDTVSRLHTARMPLKRFKLGESEQTCFELLAHDNSGNGAWSNLGNIMHATERTAASRCSIHANTLRAIGPVDTMASLLNLGGFVQDLLVLNPGSIIFQQNVHNSPEFTPTINTFMTAYDRGQIERMFRRIYLDCPLSWVNTRIDSCTLALTDIFAGSILNTIVLSLPGEQYLELKPSDVAMMAMKYAVSSNRYFS